METKFTVENNEYTERYQDVFLSEAVEVFGGMKLMFVETEVVTTKNDDRLVTSHAVVKVGPEVHRLETMWSRNLVTPEDEERLAKFHPVDVIVRFGTWTNEETGEVRKSKSPKVIYWIDADGKPFRLSGDVAPFRG